MAEINRSKCILMTIVLNTLRVLAKMEGFIVGGRNAKITDYPHSAFLAVSCVTASGTEKYSCGSSILNQWTLLSAGHCFENCESSSVIAVGVAIEYKRSELTHLVSYFAIHPQFQGQKVINDLALAKLADPLTFSDKVKRVAILLRPPYYEIADVAGWGLIDEDTKRSSFYLKSARQKIWKRKLCIKTLKKLNKGTICARGLKRSKSYGYPAAGDSGSALVVRGYIQIGLVSIKYPKISHSVIVFTHVPHYYKWIRKTAKALYCMK